MKQIKVTLSNEEAGAVLEAINNDLSVAKSSGYDDDSYVDYQIYAKLLESAKDKLNL